MLLCSFCLSELLGFSLANLPFLGSGTASLRHSEIMSQVSEKLCDELKSKEVLKKKKKNKKKRERGILLDSSEFPSGF